MKAIFNQLTKVFNTSSPSAYIPVNLWVWKWDKNGNVQYNNFKTLLNYLNHECKASI